MDIRDLQTGELSDVFARCESPIYRVMDGHGEDACNVYDAQIKHLGCKFWIYVDEDGGYEILTDDEVILLDLVEDADGDWDNSKIFRVGE